VDPLWPNGETHLRNTKVQISILIDLDILNFFRKRSSKTQPLAYKINKALRAYMESKE